MKLLTPAEYAKLHKIDKATVYRWINRENIDVVWVVQKVPMIEENATPLRSLVKKK